MKFLRNASHLPLHVLLLSLYSVLAFLTANITDVDLSAVNRLLLVFCVGAVIFQAILSLLLKNIYRAGLITFLFLLIFFSYGHVKGLLLDKDSAIGRNAFLVPIALVLFVGGIFLLRKLSLEQSRKFNLYLNLVTLLLLLFPVITIIRHELYIASFLRKYHASLESKVQNYLDYSGDMPDVYFIVLDGYARSDVLEQVVGLDNTAFLDGLRQIGFYVADCSMSNYAQTERSLATTFNMLYLDDLLIGVPDEGWAEDYFSPYIQHSQVRYFFDSLDYKTVSFFTGYYWAHWQDADYFIGDPRIIVNSQTGNTDGDGIQLTSFENLFIETTLLRTILELYHTFIPTPMPKLDFLNGISGERAVVLYPLDHLPEIAQWQGPKFVFLHLLLPHPPYVFGSQGDVVAIDMEDESARLQGYRDQVLYTNSRILPLMEEIISQTDGNVVIFLEGDHGLIDYQEPWTRMANLSAYYFPDRDYSMLYPSITPVNSFRVLLTQYFGQDFPLLEDVSYYSPTSSDKAFEIISNPCSEK